VARKTFNFTPQASAQETARVSRTGREVLRKTHDDGVAAMDNAKLVRVDRLVPNPDQPRKTIDPAYLARLADSIRRYGVLSPITVKYRLEDETFLIIAGEQRWRAAQEAGLTEVPVVVRDSSATDRYIESCMENLVRADLTEVEKGRALEELKRLLPQTWEEMADMLGLSRRRVDQMRQLTTLSEPLQEAVRTRAISGRHARQIDLLPPVLQEPALAAIVEQGLNVRQVEQVVRHLREEVSAPDGGADAGAASPQAEAAPAAEVPDGPELASPRGGPEQVAAAIAAVMGEQDDAARVRHSVPVVKKLTIIEKALRGLPLHAVGDADRAEVLARLGRIHDVLAQMESVLR
jgi:ParB family chromosome partitioning protein